MLGGIDVNASSRAVLRGGTVRIVRNGVPEKSSTRNTHSHTHTHTQRERERDIYMQRVATMTGPSRRSLALIHFALQQMGFAWREADDIHITHNATGILFP